MPSWPQEPRYLSRRTRRVDAKIKLTGRARYSSDIQAKGWLYGMILRSRWPAAEVTRINLEKARQMPGVKAAVLAREVPRTIRYYGEELAAVAATTKQACLDALRAIEVEAKTLPFVVKEQEALKPDSPQVWEGSVNVSQPRVEERGAVDKAFGECAAVVESFLTTQVELHHPMETHGSTVSWEDDQLTAWVSTQGVFSVRDGLAGSLKVDQSKVRVISEFMGGGFGSKFGAGVESMLAAQLSRAAQAPVRLMLTRFEEALAVGNRPSSFQKIKLGASADGTLLAYELDGYGSPGIGSGAATAGGGGGAEFPAPYIYQVPNTRVRQFGVAINAGQARAFRAPGHPQASFGMESIMDDLAVKLGMDPVELRLKNDPNPIRQREYKLGRERFGWQDKYRPAGRSDGPVKIGVGCAGATWGGGGNRNTRGEVQINPDGSVEVRIGTQDLGTGTYTVMAVVAAEVFGLKPEQVAVRLGDTLYPPAGGSGGSTTAPSIAPTVFATCTRALEELQQRAGVPDARGENWRSACRKLNLEPLVVAGRWPEGLSSSGAGGVQFAEVAVDTETGRITVKKITAIHDCGLIVNALTTESQVYGGILMGIGYALYENRVMDDLTGVVLNPNLETYKMTGLGDVPDIDVILINMPERGVIGIGEPVTIPTAAAIANAVANALGVRITSLPITPDKVLAALGMVPPPQV